MNIYDKIAALMPAFGMATLEEVAEAVRNAGASNVKYQHIQQLRDYPARQPRYLVELANVFNMTVEEFLDWRPGKRVPQPRGLTSSPTRIEQPAPSYDDWSDVRGFPQEVGLGDGVEGNEYAEAHKLKFRKKSLDGKRLRPHTLAVVYGKGDSMLPRIHPGDAILFDTSDTIPKDGKLYVVHAPGVRGIEYSAKRCLELDGVIYFEAINPDGDHGWKKPRRKDDPKRPITVEGRVRWIGSWED